MSVYKHHMIQFVGLNSDGLTQFLITRRGSQVILATSQTVTEAISIIDEICRQQSFGFVDESIEDSNHRSDQMQADFDRINGNGHQEVKMPEKGRIADPT